MQNPLLYNALSNASQFGGETLDIKGLNVVPLMWPEQSNVGEGSDEKTEMYVSNFINYLVQIHR